MKNIKKIIVLFLFCCSLLGCVEKENSKYNLQSPNLSEVTIKDNFWQKRQQIYADSTIPYVLNKMADPTYGNIDNFHKACGSDHSEHCGTPWNDSELYKVIEGLSYHLVSNPDKELEQKLDDLIETIGNAQEESGYLYTARTARILQDKSIPAHAGNKPFTSYVAFELYNLGHLYEAAVAHFQLTGEKEFLNIPTKNADYLCKHFLGKEIEFIPEHPVIELGLAKLYKVTKKEEYLELAKLFVDKRGYIKTDLNGKDNFETWQGSQYDKFNFVLLNFITSKTDAFAKIELTDKKSSEFSCSKISSCNIDGVFNEDFWTFNKQFKETKLKQTNNKASFAMHWDKDFLFVGVHIVDDSLVIDSEYSSEDDDGIALHIDADNSGGALDANDDIIYIKPDANQIWSLNDLSGIKHAFSINDKGYDIEVAIPWASLKTKPQKGHSFGFDMIVFDDDVYYSGPHDRPHSNLSYEPILEQTDAWGHAVQVTYLTAGMT